MLQPRRAERIAVETLVDVMAAQRAVGADEVRLAALRVLRHLLEQRLADLHRHLVRRHLHAVGAGVAGTAFVGLHVGLGHHLEHLLGLLANVLHPGVARDLVTDLAQRM